MRSGFVACLARSRQACCRRSGDCLLLLYGDGYEVVSGLESVWAECDDDDYNSVLPGGDEYLPLAVEDEAKVGHEMEKMVEGGVLLL